MNATVNATAAATEAPYDLIKRRVWRLCSCVIGMPEQLGDEVHRARADCDVCGGSGVLPPTVLRELPRMCPEIPCAPCKGTGKVSKFSDWKPVPGRPWVSERRRYPGKFQCDSCKGTGTLPAVAEMVAGAGMSLSVREWATKIALELLLVKWEALLYDFPGGRWPRMVLEGTRPTRQERQDAHALLAAAPLWSRSYLEGIVRWNAAVLSENDDHRRYTLDRALTAARFAGLDHKMWIRTVHARLAVREGIEAELL